MSVGMSFSCCGIVSLISSNDIGCSSQAMGACISCSSTATRVHIALSLKGILSLLFEEMIINNPKPESWLYCCFPVDAQIIVLFTPLVVTSLWQVLASVLLCFLHAWCLYIWYPGKVWWSSCKWFWKRAGPTYLLCTMAWPSDMRRNVGG